MASDGAMVGASIAGGLVNSAFQSGLMSQQNKYARENAEWSALNMPSLQRQGLEKAGYNPLLAVNSATDAYNLGSPSGAGAPQVDLVSAMNASTQRKAQESQSNLNETQEDVNNSQKNLNDSQVVNNALRTQADIQNNAAITQAKVALTAAQINELNARVKNLKAGTDNIDLTNAGMLGTINNAVQKQGRKESREKWLTSEDRWFNKIYTSDSGKNVGNYVLNTFNGVSDAAEWLGDKLGFSGNSAANLYAGTKVSKALAKQQDHINEISYFDKHGKFQGSSVHRKIGGKHK